MRVVIFCVGLVISMIVGGSSPFAVTQWGFWLLTMPTVTAVAMAAISLTKAVDPAGKGTQ